MQLRGRIYAKNKRRASSSTSHVALYSGDIFFFDFTRPGGTYAAALRILHYKKISVSCMGGKCIYACVHFPRTIRTIRTPREVDN